MDRIEYNADKVDIVWIINPDEPAFAKTAITKENYYYYLSKLLPIAHINPYLGSFMLMDSIEMLESFVSANSERYIAIAPSLERVRKRERVHIRFLEFYNKYGFLPFLSCQKGMLLWALSFLEQKGITYPVVVHLRKSLVRPHRNSDFNSWLEFFRYCYEWRKDVTFVVIGTYGEIDQKFENLENVVFSKNHGTTIEQDCALIQVAVMFMGMLSGPNVMAWHSDVPYLTFNFFQEIKNKKTCEKWIFDGRAYQFPYASALQKLIGPLETKELLVKEFNDLFDQIDPCEYKRKFDFLNKADLKRRSFMPILVGGG